MGHQTNSRAVRAATGPITHRVRVVPMGLTDLFEGLWSKHFGWDSDRRPHLCFSFLPSPPFSVMSFPATRVGTGICYGALQIGSSGSFFSDALPCISIPLCSVVPSNKKSVGLTCFLQSHEAPFPSVSPTLSPPSLFHAFRRFLPRRLLIRGLSVSRRTARSSCIMSQSQNNPMKHQLMVMAVAPRYIRRRRPVRVSPTVRSIQTLVHGCDPITPRLNHLVQLSSDLLLP